MRYFIIGFKNSGKTTFGKSLARKMKLDFLDLDEYIEEREKSTIPELYSRLGETEFRKLEWKALREVIRNNHMVISTGGGAPCNCDNMSLMEKYGHVIYLKVGNETLIGRLKKAVKDRPIVLGKTEEELRQYVADLRERCEHHYNRAEYIVDGENLNMDAIVKMLDR